MTKSVDSGAAAPRCKTLIGRAFAYLGMSLRVTALRLRAVLIDLCGFVALFMLTAITCEPQFGRLRPLRRQRPPPAGGRCHRAPLVTVVYRD